MSENKDITIEQIMELMRIVEYDPLGNQRLQRIFRNKQYLERQKEIERFFNTMRQRHEYLIFTTPSPDFHSRVSKLLHQFKIKEQTK